MPEKLSIFVTGGTGFFGRALLRHWAKCPGLQFDSARYTILSRAPLAFRNRFGSLLQDLDVELVSGDVQRPDTLPVGNYSHILHSAADSTIGLRLTPLQRFGQIVEGTRNVLNLAVRAGVKRVLFTSSGGVYGPQPMDLAAIPESYLGMADPLNTQNAYSVGKRMAEHLAALYSEKYGIEIVIARCFAFVGPDLPLDAHFAIGNFMRDALAGRDVVVMADGSALRTYLDQRDLANWLSTMLLSGRSQQAYNVGSNEVISIAELAALVAKLAGTGSQVRVLGQTTSGQAAQRDRFIPDISLAEKELGLRVKHQLRESIEFALKNINENLGLR